MMTVIVLAVIVVINLIVAQIPTSKTQIDLSTQKMYSITDETKTALKDLDQDVTLYYIVQKGSEDDTIEKLLEHYDELSDHIKVETKRPGSVSEIYESVYRSDGSCKQCNCRMRR